MRLGEYAKPRVSYVLSAMDLSVLTGYEHEQWQLGDIVTVDDRDLNLTISTVFRYEGKPFVYPVQFVEKIQAQSLY